MARTGEPGEARRERKGDGALEASERRAEDCTGPELPMHLNTSLAVVSHTIDLALLAYLAWMDPSSCVDKEKWRPRTAVSSTIDPTRCCDLVALLYFSHGCGTREAWRGAFTNRVHRSGVILASPLVTGTGGFECDNIISRMVGFDLSASFLAGLAIFERWWRIPTLAIARNSTASPEWASTLAQLAALGLGVLHHFKGHTKEAPLSPPAPAPARRRHPESTLRVRSTWCTQTKYGSIQYSQTNSILALIFNPMSIDYPPTLPPHGAVPSGAVTRSSPLTSCSSFWKPTSPWAKNWDAFWWDTKYHPTSASILD